MTTAPQPRVEILDFILLIMGAGFKLMILTHLFNHYFTTAATKTAKHSILLSIHFQIFDEGQLLFLSLSDKVGTAWKV